MIERFFNYSLTAMLLLMGGIFVSAFTFGAYTMESVLWDTAGIMWSIAMTDCIYNIFKIFFGKDGEEG